MRHRRVIRHTITILIVIPTVHIAVRVWFWVGQVLDLCGYVVTAETVLGQVHSMLDWSYRRLLRGEADLHDMIRNKEAESQ